MERPSLAQPIYQAIPLSPDDNILVRGISSTILMDLIIQGTCIDRRGKLVNFSETLNLTSIGTLFSGTFRLGYSFLLSLSITTSTSLVPDGSCYVQSALINPIVSTPIQFRKILSQGYVSTYQGISYGSNNPNPATSDPWYILNLPVSPPAAGAEWSFTCPQYLILNITQVAFTLTASAVAGNRLSYLRTTNPNGNTFTFADITFQTASQVFRHCYGGFTTSIVSGFGDMFHNFSSLLLSGSHLIGSFSPGLLAGDIYSSIALYGKGRTLPIQ